MLALQFDTNMSPHANTCNEEIVTYTVMYTTPHYPLDKHLLVTNIDYFVKKIVFNGIGERSGRAKWYSRKQPCKSDNNFSVFSCYCKLDTV